MKMIEPLDSPDNARHFLDMDAALRTGEVCAVTSHTPRISLKQWKMFHAVIDAGGFFGAADSLHVTQSTISHAIAKIQEQLTTCLYLIRGHTLAADSAAQRFADALHACSECFLPADTANG